MFCVKDREAGETASVAVGVIFNVTGIVCGLLATFPGLVAAIVTVPVYVPIARPFGLAEKVRFEAVIPEPELASNQFEPVPVLVATLKLICVPSVLVTAKPWKEEVVDPAGIEKVRLPGLTTRSAVLLTTSVTGIV